MAGWKEILAFNRQEQRGVFFLLLIVFILQVFYYLQAGGYLGKEAVRFRPDKSLLGILDSLQLAERESEGREAYSFNPNFINDFRGYTLGMSALELDRLYAYRRSNKFIRSARQFQEVTGISDSLLGEIAPRFKFPKFTESRRSVEKPPSGNLGMAVDSEKGLNEVTARELRRINGIGPVLSERIIRFRDALGGFLVDSQLHDVYGLDSAVVERTLRYYKVKHPPPIRPIDVNLASVEELSELVYITYPVAEAIVRYREKVGNIGAFDEISQLEGFPSDKIDRIKLYLRL